MARKQTPDILGEILNGTEDIPAAGPAPERPPKSQSASKRKTPAREASKPQAAEQILEPQGRMMAWDYLLVTFQEYRGWRPRFINGREIRSWMEAPVIHEHIALLGDDGWELVAASSGRNLYGASDHYQLYFRRLKR